MEVWIRPDPFRDLPNEVYASHVCDDVTNVRRLGLRPTGDRAMISAGRTFSLTAINLALWSCRVVRGPGKEDGGPQATPGPVIPATPLHGLVLG